MSRGFIGTGLLMVIVLFCAGVARELAAETTDSSDMVLIPAGVFIMGTDTVDLEGQARALGLTEPWYENEHPRHRLKLAAYRLDRYEVTQAQYQRFVRETGRTPPPDWSGGKPPAGQENLPVVFVNWNDARDYCRWAGKRLPTEREWEKAARGPEGFLYPWGNTFHLEYAHIARGFSSSRTPSEVGQYAKGRSPYGVYDMTGNVWEWTASEYNPYPGNASPDRRYGKGLKVNRGLSFMGLGHFPPEIYQEMLRIVARASYRSYDFPDARLPDVGFRCARS